MSNFDLAYVTPEVVTWAIGRSGLSYAKISKSLDVSQEQVKAWGHGDAYPPFGKAINLAKILRVPFGYFFLSNPPTVEVPLPDFRTRLSVESREPSVDFLELLYSVLSKQEWYREYAEEHRAVRLPFVGSFTIRDAPNRVAASIRETLGINDKLREEVNSLSDYLSLLSDCAESAGIIVMRSGVVGNDVTRPLSVDEFQGFTIADDIAPLIFINSRDFEAARIFTLAHELAHIWIGRGGISKPDETDVTEKASKEDESKVELFCNAVAAEVLVPKTEFLKAWQGQPLKSLARRFRVSTIVILRRAYEFDLINRNQFFALLKQEQGAQKPKKQSGGGGDSETYYRTIRSRHSAKFIDALVTDVRQGGTTFRDAARLMNMKVPSWVNFTEKAR